MQIESAVQKFYSFSKPELKKALASSSREDLADSDQASFSTAKSQLSARLASGGQATSNAWSLIPKFLLSPSNKLPGLTFKLVDWREFRDICHKLKLTDGPGGSFTGSPFTIEHRVRLRAKAYTTGAYDCNAGGVVNASKGTAFHVDPKDLTEAGNKKVDEELSKDIAELRKKGVVRAFITGGQKTSKVSRQLNALLVSIFKKAGINDVTQIWGRGYGSGCSTDFILDVKNSKVYLCAPGDYNKNILTLPELFENYERVNFAPGDGIETADGLFPWHEVNSAAKTLAVC